MVKKPQCTKYPGRIYVRGCDCPSCVARKAFHAANRKLAKAYVEKDRLTRGVWPPKPKTGETE